MTAEELKAIKARSVEYERDIPPHRRVSLANERSYLLAEVESLQAEVERLRTALATAGARLGNAGRRLGEDAGLPLLAEIFFEWQAEATGAIERK